MTPFSYFLALTETLDPPLPTLTAYPNHKTCHMACNHWSSTYPFDQIRHNCIQPLKNIIPISASHKKPLHVIRKRKRKKRRRRMAQAMASTTGASQQLGLGSLSRRRVSVGRAGFIVRAQQSPVESDTVVQTGRRAALGLIAAGVTGGAFAQVALAAARSIKIGPPPPPSGGLPGTENSDQARDFDLPLKNRFYLQPLSPSEAVARVKESAKDIINLKSQIDKRAWPYVQNDLRLKASYLRYDLNTIISAKPKEEKKPLKEIYGKLFATIDELDHAAKIKSPEEAEKYYAETISVLNDVLAKLG